MRELTPYLHRRGTRLSNVWLYTFVSFFGVFFAFLPAGAMVQKFAFLIVMTSIFIRQKFKIYFPKGMLGYVFALLLLFFYSFISSYWLFESLTVALLVSQKYFFLILCLCAASQICVALSDPKNHTSLKRVIIFLVVTQFIFVIVKFLILGKIDEGFLIGSMHHNAGQLGFLFPALMIPVVCFLFYPKKIWLALGLILLLIGFGALNEKRSIFYLGPVIIVSSLYALRGKNLSLKSSWRNSLIICACLGLMSFLSNEIGSLSGAEAVNSISSDNRLMYLFSYAVEYLTMDYGGALQAMESVAIKDTNVQVGRIIVWAKGLDLMASSSTLHQLFGHGFGYVTPSEYINESDNLFTKLGFRGAISGALELFIEGGIIALGLILYLFISPLLHLLRLRRVLKKFKREGSRDYQASSITIILLLIFIFDFFFYSNILLSTLPLPVLFFMLIYTVNLSYQRAQRSRKTYGEA
tara:strand:+ start:90 stop:1490 length:1401 start_codon:yes stop_codon:yes gene_type:complete